MKAIVCKEFGPTETLVFEDLPLRATGPAEERIKVEAAGVNFPDVLIIQNKYQFKGTPPFAPGGEVCGTILEVGAKVTQWKVGDRVAALTMQGGFAEECIAPAMACVAVPATMSSAVAAAFHLVYGTVIHALQDRGELKSGETLLVLGASGGVGLGAVQLGKLMGARVIAAASSDDKLALCKAQGADALINYNTQSLKDEVKKLTQGKGADVIFDPVGGQYAQDAFSCINWKGRHLVVGFAAGPIPEIALNRLLLKGCDSRGVFWGAFIQREPDKQAANVRQLYQWFEDGKLSPLVSKQYPLAQGAQALRDMADRKVTGKVVLVV
ncbi:MAG: NADPH:quinone oxidoreductase family protein [Panacagrimonas sp.]